MGKEQFTPGPWAIEPPDPTSRGNWIYDEHYQYVVLVVKRDDGRDAEIANAHLIAASPTMFAYISYRADNGDEEARAIVESINATI